MPTLAVKIPEDTEPDQTAVCKKMASWIFGVKRKPLV